MKTLTTYFTIFTIAMFTLSSCSNDDAVDMNNYGDIEAKAPKKGDMTIKGLVEASIAGDPSEFNLLFAALEYAGITDVFDGTDQYTVFAPTDQAFIDLVVALDTNIPDFDANDPFNEIDRILGAGAVAAVLQYHVAEGRRAANSVVPNNNYRTIETLSGASFMVDSSGMIMAVGNSANIVAADISASNGIIHVIDAVILPVDLGF